MFGLHCGRFIEALHERIIGRFTRSREVDLCSVLVDPQVHRSAGELTAVVAEQHLGHPTATGNYQ